MKVYDFNGQEYNFPPSGYMPGGDDTRPRSDLHIRARNLLRSMYPTRRILEEVPLPGIRVFADFYVPHSCAVIEVHGEQHYKYTPFFHGSRFGYATSKANDKLKQEWCEINDISYIVLPFDKDENDWRRIIDSD